MTRETLSYFGGLFSALGGKAPATAAGDLLNVRTGPTLRPRLGFARLTVRPEGPVTVRGLAALSGAGEGSGTPRELLMVRTEGGRTYPLRAALPLAGTPSFTEVKTTTKDGIVPVAMEDRPVTAFTFRKDAYVVQPGAATTVYRHEIGNAASFTPIQNTAYIPPPPDPTFSATVNEIVSIAYTPGTGSGADTAVFSAGQVGGESAVVTEEHVQCRFRDNQDGGGDAGASLTVTYATAKTIPRGTVYLSIAIEADAGIERFFTSGAYLKLLVDGFEHDLAGVRVTALDSVTLAITGLVPLGLAYPVTFQGFRVAWRDKVKRLTEGDFAKVTPLQLGGTLLTATNPAQRPWTGNVPATGILYGARVRNAGDGTVTTLLTTELNDAAIAGPDARDAEFPIGVTVDIDLDPPAPFEGRFVQFLRKDATGKWRLLGETPAAATRSLTDDRREDEVQALPEVTDTAGATTTDPPTPPFTATGIVAGVTYKDWVVWFTQGGVKNVRHSHKGKPLELREGPDTAYVDDPTAPGDYSLEGQADEPIGGVQAGLLLVVFGRAAVYTQYGDAPSAMTPLRRIPEAGTAAGPRAFCRYREPGGGYSAAWMDRHGNAFELGSAPAFSGDARAEPRELSRGVRGYAREFLGSDLTGVIAQYDERRDSLWFVLGRRALVLRPRDTVEGDRRWEAYDYNVVEDEYGTTHWTSWLSASTATQVADPAILGGNGATPGGEFWTVGPADAITLSAGRRSRTIRRTGFLSAAIPAGQAVYEIEAQIADEISTGPLSRAAEVFAPGGGPILTTVLPNGTYALAFGAGPLPLQAAIAAGALRSEVRVQNDRPPEWDDPANWELTLEEPPDDGSGGLPTGSPGGAQISGEAPSGVRVERTLTVRARYLPPASPPGSPPGPPPPEVDVLVVGSARFDPKVGNSDAEIVSCTGTVDDGLGQQTTATRTTNSAGDVVAAGAGRLTIPLTAGVGRAGVTMWMIATNENALRLMPYTFALTSIALVPEPPATYSGTVQMRARYGGGVPERPGTIEALAFERGESWALRSDAALLALETGPETGDELDGPTNGGTGRDAGRAMPTGRWRGGWHDGLRARVADVTGTRAAGSVLRAAAESPTATWLQTIPPGRTYGRFPTGAQAVRWRFGADVPDGAGGIDGLSFDVVPLAPLRADR